MSDVWLLPPRRDSVGPVRALVLAVLVQVRPRPWVVRVLVDLVHLAPLVLADRLLPAQVLVLVLAQVLLQADLLVPPAASARHPLSRPSSSAAMARTTPSSTADPTYAPAPRSSWQPKGQP
jgi:hypothetical protein